VIAWRWGCVDWGRPRSSCPHVLIPQGEITDGSIQATHRARTRSLCLAGLFAGFVVEFENTATGITGKIGKKPFGTSAIG